VKFLSEFAGIYLHGRMESRLQYDEVLGCQPPTLILGYQLPLAHICSGRPGRAQSRCGDHEKQVKRAQTLFGAACFPDWSACSQETHPTQGATGAASMQEQMEQLQQQMKELRQQQTWRQMNEQGRVLP